MEELRPVRIQRAVVHRRERVAEQTVRRHGLAVRDGCRAVARKGLIRPAVAHGCVQEIQHDLIRLRGRDLRLPALLLVRHHAERAQKLRRLGIAGRAVVRRVLLQAEHIIRLCMIRPGFQTDRIGVVNFQRPVRVLERGRVAPVAVIAQHIRRKVAAVLRPAEEAVLGVVCQRLRQTAGIHKVAPHRVARQRRHGRIVINARQRRAIAIPLIGRTPVSIRRADQLQPEPRVVRLDRRIQPRRAGHILRRALEHVQKDLRRLLTRQCLALCVLRQSLFQMEELLPVLVECAIVQRRKGVAKQALPRHGLVIRDGSRAEAGKGIKCPAVADRRVQQVLHDPVRLRGRDGVGPRLLVIRHEAQHA